MEQVLSISKLIFIDVSWNFQLHRQVIIWAFMGRAKQTFLIRILCKTRLVYTPKLPTQYGWSWFGAGRKVTFKFWLSYCNIVRIARKILVLWLRETYKRKETLRPVIVLGIMKSLVKNMYLLLYMNLKNLFEEMIKIRTLLTATHSQPDLGQVRVTLK